MTSPCNGQPVDNTYEQLMDSLKLLNGGGNNQLSGNLNRVESSSGPVIKIETVIRPDSSISGLKTTKKTASRLLPSCAQATTRAESDAKDSFSSKITSLTPFINSQVNAASTTLEQTSEKDFLNPYALIENRKIPIESKQSDSEFFFSYRNLKMPKDPVQALQWVSEKVDNLISRSKALMRETVSDESLDINPIPIAYDRKRAEGKRRFEIEEASDEKKSGKQEISQPPSKKARKELEKIE